MGDRADFLASACREAARRAADDAAVRPLADLRAEVAALPPVVSFAGALAGPGVAVIAEVKRASPSRGRMADIPDAAALATAYQDGGAAAISVLTEPVHFHGSLEDLRAVAGAVARPVIRKDFVVEDYQLWQARQAGAAAALLIVAGLGGDQLAHLMGTAHQAGLGVLVETHDADEVARAVHAHSTVHHGTADDPRLVLGINARDLVTLQVDREQIARVRAQVDLPDGALLVAESGVRGPDDVRAYARVGADAVLVGEHVATAADPRAAVADLVGAVAGTRSPPSEDHAAPRPRRAGADA